VSVNKKIGAAVSKVIRLLADENFDAAEMLTRGERLSARQMRDAIRKYGQTVVVGPPEQLQKMNLIEVRDSVPRRWSAQVPLWTKEEGQLKPAH